MKISNAFLAAALLSTAMTSSAMAEGFYVAADLGKISYSNSESQFTTATYANPSSLTIGGGYHINQFVGVEAGYSIIQDSTLTTSFAGASTDETVKSSSLQIAAVGTYSINQMFDVFAKVGLASNTTDYSATCTRCTFGAGIITAQSASKTGLMFGIGGQYNINRQFGIRVQYQDLGTVPALPGNKSDLGLTVFSVGGVFNF